MRDPRGVFNSRMQPPFSQLCRARPRCWKPTVACKKLAADLEAARRLSTIFPESLVVLRYEDLSFEPEKMTRLLLNFLDLPWTRSMDNFLAKHTSHEQFLLGSNKNLVQEAKPAQLLKILYPGKKCLWHHQEFLCDCDGLEKADAFGEGEGSGESVCAAFKGGSQSPAIGIYHMVREGEFTNNQSTNDGKGT